MYGGIGKQLTGWSGTALEMGKVDQLEVEPRLVSQRREISMRPVRRIHSEVCKDSKNMLGTVK